MNPNGKLRPSKMELVKMVARAWPSSVRMEATRAPVEALTRQGRMGRRLAAVVVWRLAGWVVVLLGWERQFLVV